MLQFFLALTIKVIKRRILNEGSKKNIRLDFQRGSWISKTLDEPPILFGTYHKLDTEANPIGDFGKVGSARVLPKLERFLLFRDKVL
jgi:hypothetical protein